MKNEKGEATLFCILVLVALSSLLTLASLELQRNFKLLQKRTHLFLCVKETKGELNNYLKLMGQTNWVLKNTHRAQIAATIFPPLWPYIANASKLKKALKGMQFNTSVLYLSKLNKLKHEGCPVDPQMFLTPYQLGNDFMFSRTNEGVAKIRKSTWTHYFLERPYLLTLTVNAAKGESLQPKIDYRAEEKMGTLSSHLSSR